MVVHHHIQYLVKLRMIIKFWPTLFSSLLITSDLVSMTFVLGHDTLIGRYAEFELIHKVQTNMEYFKFFY